MFPAKVQRAVHFGRCHDARKKWQVAVLGRFQNCFIQAGRHAELRADINRALHLFRRQERAGANGHVGNFLADALDGLGGGGGAEGDFHDFQSAGEQRLGQWHGVLGPVNCRDAKQPLFEKRFGVHKICAPMIHDGRGE